MCTVHINRIRKELLDFVLKARVEGHDPANVTGQRDEDHEAGKRNYIVIPHSSHLTEHNNCGEREGPTKKGKGDRKGKMSLLDARTYERPDAEVLPLITPASARAKDEVRRISHQRCCARRAGHRPRQAVPPGRGCDRQRVAVGPPLCGGRPRTTRRVARERAPRGEA